jgi:hypothetical protein
MMNLPKNFWTYAKISFLAFQVIVAFVNGPEPINSRRQSAPVLAGDHSSRILGSVSAALSSRVRTDATIPDHIPVAGVPVLLFQRSFSVLASLCLG